jgi:hypothetical protein
LLYLFFFIFVPGFGFAGDTFVGGADEERFGLNSFFVTKILENPIETDKYTSRLIPYKSGAPGLPFKSGGPDGVFSCSR